MTGDPFIRTYRGYTLTITPRQDRCSNFALAVAGPDGVEFKHLPQAGKTEENGSIRGSTSPRAPSATRTMSMIDAIAEPKQPSIAISPIRMT